MTTQTLSQTLFDAPKVGGDILAWCTRCKIDLAHVVISMLDRKPARVVCKTCKSQHNYRLGGSATPVRSSSKSKTQKLERTTVKASEYWEQKVNAKSKAAILPYSPKAYFKAGDLIQHTQFGVGMIEELRDPNKIVVLFRVGDKTLVHRLA